MMSDRTAEAAYPNIIGFGSVQTEGFTIKVSFRILQLGIHKRQGYRRLMKLTSATSLHQKENGQIKTISSW